MSGLLICPLGFNARSRLTTRRWLVAIYPWARWFVKDALSITKHWPIIAAPKTLWTILFGFRNLTHLLTNRTDCRSILDRPKHRNCRNFASIKARGHQLRRLRWLFSSVASKTIAINIDDRSKRSSLCMPLDRTTKPQNL